MTSIGLILLIVQTGSNVPRGQMHPEWGPEPPVAQVGHDLLSSEEKVCNFIFPVLAKARWRNDFNEDRGAFRHTGIDIKAPKMTPIVAPFRGVIGFKSQSFWIYGDNGWAILGTHLNDDNLGTHDHSGSKDLMFAPNLVPNSIVETGQFIGYVGQSGDATAPHLHFEVFPPGDGSTMDRTRNPFPSLKVAQQISAPRPTVRFPNVPPATGIVRVAACRRSFDQSKRELVVILVEKQFPDGSTRVVASPQYRKYKIDSSAVLEEISTANESTPIILEVDTRDSSAVPTVKTFRQE